MNKITSTIYLFFLTLLCLGLSQNSFAQVSGDFRSTATGTWNSAATWQRYNGTTWDASGVGSNNPGQTPTASSSVWIQTAHLVTLTANESCNDLHIATGTTALSATLLGKIGLSTFTLSVNGKMRDYFATLNTIPGTTTANGYSIYPFTGTTGKVSIVGATRNIFNSGEWGATITTPSTGIFPLEINLSDNTQVATFSTNIKSTSFNLVTGIVSGATISMDNGTIGQGNATIASGTTLISSGGTVFQRTGTSRAGILTIVGTLKLSGATPAFAMNSVSNTGTIEYSRLGVQTFIAATNSGVAMTYQNLVLSGSGAKTFTSNLTIGNDLTLNAGATFTVPSGLNVTIGNKVNNNGAVTDFVIQNNANLVQVNNVSNTGAITVKRNSNTLNRLDYTMWSSPVSDGTQTLVGFSPLTSQLPTSRFYIYDNTQGTTGLYSSVSPTTPFATGTGYLIRMPNEDPSNLGTSSPYYLGTSTLTYNGVFTGVPNNGDVTLNVTSGTYNGVGNPYPSTINADLFLSDNSITSGTDALYFWRKSNNSAATSYATYTTAGGTANSGDPLSITPDATIQVGQGFIAKSTSATLKFTNSMRTANNGNKILKTKLIERNRIWLNLSSETTPISQMMVAYMTGATQGIDPTIDGSYINDSETALNSLISNKEYVIQGRSLPFDGTDVVPLAFKTATAGKFTIAIDHTDGLFATAQDVYLVDNATGSETDLKAGSYTFDAAAGVDNARFSLKYQKTLKVDAPAFNDNSVSVYKNNGTLYVNSGAVAIANIKVFDIQGRLIAEQKNVKSNTATISNLKATQQVLIVKVTGQDNSVVSKKVLN